MSARKGGILQRRAATRSHVISVTSGPCACATVQDPGQDLISGYANNLSSDSSPDRYLPYASPSFPLSATPKPASPNAETEKKLSQVGSQRVIGNIVQSKMKTANHSTNSNQVKPLITAPVVDPDGFKGTSILLPHAKSVELELSSSIDSNETTTEAPTLDDDQEQLVEPELHGSSELSGQPERLGSPEQFASPETLNGSGQLQAIPASTSKKTTEYNTETEPVLLDETTPTPQAIPPEILEPVSIELPAKVDKPDEIIVLKATKFDQPNDKKSVTKAIAPPQQQPFHVARRIVHSEQTDQFGLPTSPTIDFKELPPVGSHQFRPLNLQRQQLDDDKVNGIPNIDIHGNSLNSKTNQPHSQLELPEIAPAEDLQTSADRTIPIQTGTGMHSTNVNPKSLGAIAIGQPMLRMRAIPSKRKSDDLPPVATIKLKSALFVGSDLKRLDPNELQQATREDIAPKNQVEILDR